MSFGGKIRTGKRGEEENVKEQGEKIKDKVEIS
jgi:hypothetical protein